MKGSHKTTIIIRGTITAVLFLAGFAFPLIWLATAFFAYTTYSAFPDPDPETPENMYRPRQSSITADDPDWRERYFLACESPAETGFLKAMINGYGLKPENGILVSSGVELDMQTEYKPYRLDFLVNKWLVVEIDGATWHSSPDAIARDGVRDEFFAAKGFRVLRIPAKTVFNTPTMAVDMVRTAIAKGRPQQKVVTKFPPISVAKTLMNAAKSVEKIITEVDAHITKASAIQEATSPSKQIFETEKMVIESALETAKRTVELEGKLAANPNLRRHYAAAHADLEGIMRSGKSAQPETEATITIAALSWPSTHADPEINTAVLKSYFTVIADRKRCFDDARRQISEDLRLSPHVQSHLERFGCHATWKEIAAKKEPFSLDAFLKEIEVKHGSAPQKYPPPSR